MNSNFLAHWNVAIQPMLASLTQRTVIEYLIYCGAITVVALGIFYWAVAVRKPRKRKHRHHWRSGSRKNSAPENPAGDASRRRRRRAELPRNPTLAETRGLPPLRDGQSDSTQLYQH